MNMNGIFDKGEDGIGPIIRIYH